MNSKKLWMGFAILFLIQAFFHAEVIAQRTVEADIGETVNTNDFRVRINHAILAESLETKDHFYAAAEGNALIILNTTYINNKKFSKIEPFSGSLEIYIGDEYASFEEVEYFYDNDVEGWYMKDEIGRIEKTTMNLVYEVPLMLLEEAEDVKYFVDNEEDDEYYIILY